ncbi:MAG TPA: TolC family protein [Pyrinomonadaceae bacterium]|jgi:cobalt-zinc-cadmium efflux system outer membrane protein|nr:TolC family protein [Pyrinomonadaceae bacterium]
MKSIVSVLLLLVLSGLPGGAQSTAGTTTRTGQVVRRITVAEAVSIFLQQNLQLVASRYDIDTAEAEKLTARLKPNPEITVGSSGLPLKFTPFLAEQTFVYNISQDFELGGKRQKRITAAEANAELARAEFEIAVWQMTNDVKKKFYAVLLARSLLDLSLENQKTFAQIVDHTRDVFHAGEISGLDLQRLEVEQIKFDTDVANSERDSELALRDLRLALGGDYRTTEVEVAGAMEYYETYDLTMSDLRDKALAARPDLKAAQLAERAADANIILQNAQRIPNLTLSGGVNHVIAGGSNYNFGVGFTLPVSDRNQGERAKALIDKRRAQNQEQIVTNQILSDVDKAVIAVDLQKRRVELYKSGVLTKVTDIQNATEYALKAGENSTLELLDAIRTRRETLAAFYQAIFDYQMSLLDLELATATPLHK